MATAEPADDVSLRFGGTLRAIRSWYARRQDEGTTSLAALHLTTSTSSPTAAQRVFQTPELLENILLVMRPMRSWQERVVIKTIIRSQRVNKTFKAVIEESPALQSFLFFAPDPYWKNFCPPGSAALAEQHTVHPLSGNFCSKSGPFDVIKCYGKATAYQDPKAPLFVQFSRETLIAGSGIKSGSWRRMLLVQTDYPTFWVEAGVYSSWFDDSRVLMEFESNATIGQILGQVQAQLDTWEAERRNGKRRHAVLLDD